MPQKKKAPRLWLRPERRNSFGIVTHKSSYVILDGQKHTATGCSPNERSAAEAALADYVVHKYAKSRSARNPNIIPIADVLSTYQINVAPTTSNPAIATQCIRRLSKFFGDCFLAEISEPLCRDFIAQSSTDSMARRDLEVLRAAINHHQARGLHRGSIAVFMPAIRPPRDHWPWIDPSLKNGQPVVYFIKASEFIKIGYSTNWQRRAREIESSSPHKTTLLYVAKGSRDDETVIHQKFHEYRINGEWFQAAPALLAHITRLRDGRH